MWLQENLLAVGVFGLCTALVQVGGPTSALSPKNWAAEESGSLAEVQAPPGDCQGRRPRGGDL